MKYKILIVDDETVNLRLLERLFRRTYDVISASSGEEALKMLELHNIALIISDQRMPAMTGIEFLRRASEMRPKTVRIILTGYTDVNDLVEAINSGVVYKYITKPWVNEELRQTVIRGLEHYEAFKDRHDLMQHNARLKEQLEATRQGFLLLISETLRTKDATVPDRCRRIADHAAALGRWLNLDEEAVEQLSLAASLCEIGRLGVPNAAFVTNNSLNEEDSRVLGMNSVFWASILDEIPEMKDVALAIRFQYARYDGTGFPNQISGEQIPLCARIVSIVAAFDSLVFPREGREPSGEEDAIKTLKSDAGSKFDPDLVEAFRVVSAIGSVRPDLAAARIDNSSLENRIGQ